MSNNRFKDWFCEHGQTYSFFRLYCRAVFDVSFFHVLSFCGIERTTHFSSFSGASEITTRQSVSLGESSKNLFFQRASCNLVISSQCAISSFCVCDILGILRARLFRVVRCTCGSTKSPSVSFWELGSREWESYQSNPVQKAYVHSPHATNRSAYARPNKPRPHDNLVEKTVKIQERCGRHIMCPRTLLSQTDSGVVRQSHHVASHSTFPERFSPTP